MAMRAEPESIIDLYQRHARAWVAKRTAKRKELIETSWLVKFRTLLDPGSAILDLGCGAGKPIAGNLIEHGHTITGVDSSPDMIAMCREAFPDQEWMVGDMRSLSLDRVFAGIIAWDSFFHLCHDDQRRMFSTFRKHAASRSALMFTSGHYHGEAIGRLEGEPLYHASLDPAEYRCLLEENGYEVVTHVVEDPACDRHTIWLARLS
jgi:SAM-dependent methyltransferase